MMGAEQLFRSPFTWHGSPAWVAWAASGAVVGLRLPSVAAVPGARRAWAGLPWAAAWAAVVALAIGYRYGYVWPAGRAWPGYLGRAGRPPSGGEFCSDRRE